MRITNGLAMTEKVVPLRANSSWKEATGLAGRLRQELEAHININANDLAGYVVLSVDVKGCWQLSWKVDEESPIGQTMLAGLATAAIQRDMLADSAATEAIVRNGLREPIPPKEPQP